jgi:hypothetical protein
MSLEQAEHARWVRLKQKPMAEYGLAVDKTLVESAARGFQQPPANSMEAILNVGQVTKLNLTDLNGKLYEEQENIVFQIDEFALKLTLEYAKLELAIYKQEIMDALALEHAQMEYDFKIQQADIARLKAENNARSVLLIRAEADQKAAITDYKIRQEEAKRLGLDKELELLEAQKDTAEERLKVIDALKEVIAVESLIVEAENRKAEALELVLEAEWRLLAIKEGMIPLYENLADYKKALASAIIAEISVKKAIIELGYDWIAVKQAETASFVSQKAAELDVENARTSYIRASNANDKARASGNVSIADAKNSATDSALTLKEAAKILSVDTRINARLERFIRDIANRIEINTEQAAATVEKLTAQIASIASISESQDVQIRECAHTSMDSALCKHTDHYISSD